MINYNYFDLDKLPLLVSIASIYDIAEISDSTVWMMAKMSDEIPNFENILLKEYCERIEANVFSYELGHFDYFVNGKDSHFYLDGEEIKSVEHFKELVRVNELNKNVA